MDYGTEHAQGAPMFEEVREMSKAGKALTVQDLIAILERCDGGAVVMIESEPDEYRAREALTVTVHNGTVTISNNPPML